MGLNLPARTVVFSAAHKFDGRARRLLKPTEYTQMAGRAGRRGLDTQGYSVILLSQWLGADDGEEMLSRRYSPLRSRFSLRFATLLKLLRTEGADSSTNARTWRALCPGNCCATRTRVAAFGASTAPGAIAPAFGISESLASTRHRSTATVK